MAYSQTQKMESKVNIKVSAEKLYDVFCNKTHQIGNIFPEKVQSVEIYEGEWGNEGSIIAWKILFEGKAWVVKEVIESIDKKNHKITFKVIDGNLLEHYKSFKYILQVTPLEKGGVANLALEYEKQNDQTSDPHIMLKFSTDVLEKVNDSLSEGHN
ncbi:unnamed protein product [Sphenostylis stenocarpa]|uniref:Bet v I/Major latex protein domain-containing protein n=1 Tax=Sphenostylis stenocarpa TaxID=92480 RepID=A0AA86T1H3_9FABA|nr:unnamed protein product [Sphenostylis stenocarpa]